MCLWFIWSLLLLFCVGVRLRPCCFCVCVVVCMRFLCVVSCALCYGCRVFVAYVYLGYVLFLVCVCVVVVVVVVCFVCVA